MSKLKTYKANQKTSAPKAIEREPSGVACDEKGCNGEMMMVVPHEPHYFQGRAGEPGAVKSGLRRAICGACGWRGWV